jgi:hypothetical protein
MLRYPYNGDQLLLIILELFTCSVKGYENVKDSMGDEYLDWDRRSLVHGFTILTFWHQSFPFNSNKSQTWRNNFLVYYPDVCLQLNMFRAFSAHHQELNDWSGSLWFYLRIVVIVVLCSWSDRPAGSRIQHDCHHDTKVKPEAATVVIELLMMGGKTPEICWAVNKRQDNKLKNCCIRLVIYLNCTMMHRHTNLKFYI